MQSNQKNSSFKKILIISTGGTISCCKTDDGLKPQLTFKELINSIEYNVDSVYISGLQLMNIDSANIIPSYWVEMAGTIKENYHKYDGFVITHGTDTLSYTAAALSYLIQNSIKPIILTGSQYPLSEANTDAIDNLNISVDFACRKIGGIFLAFNNKIILGTQARKIKSVDKDSFITLNKELVATYNENNVCINEKFNIRSSLEPVFYDKLNNKVSLIKIAPGLNPNILEYAGIDCDAIVVETYGIGSIPFNNEMNFERVIKKLNNENKIIIISSQTLYEGTHMHKYEVGNNVLKYKNVIEGKMLSTECCFTKAMWALTQTKDIHALKEIFYTSINNDM